MFQQFTADLKHAIHPESVTYMESDWLRSKNTASIQIKSVKVYLHMKMHLQETQRKVMYQSILVSKPPTAIGKHHSTYTHTPIMGLPPIRLQIEKGEQHARDKVHDEGWGYQSYKLRQLTAPSA